MEATKPQYEVSIGKTLLGNWVEERQVSHLDNCPKSIKELHKLGHSNVLSQTEEKRTFETTCEVSYKPSEVKSCSRSGRRKELLEKQLYEKISSEIQEEMTPKSPPIDYTSTTKKDFSKEFECHAPKATMEHDVNAEMPLTFWHQNLNTVHGVTQTKQGKSPFKKNAAFSTPISESLDAQKPGDEWNF